MKHKISFLIIFFTGISIASIYFFEFADKQNLDSLMPHMSFVWFCLILSVAISLQFLGHYLRAYKSKLLLNLIRKSDTKTLFKGLSVGYLFNTLLPLRLGEIIRAFYVGDELAISKTSVFMSIIIERIVDGLILGLSVISSALIITNISTGASIAMIKIGFAFLVISLVLFFILILVIKEDSIGLKLIHRLSSLFNAKIKDRMRFIAWSCIFSTRLYLDNKKNLLKYLLLSCLMWSVYFLSTLCILLGFYVGDSFQKLWYSIQSTYAGVVAPSGPGYIGSFQIIVTDLLGKIGLTEAASYAVVAWIVIVLPVSIVGVIVLVQKKHTSSQEPTDQVMLINKLHRDRDISSELSQFLDAYFQNEPINKILTEAELNAKFNLIKSFKGGSNAHTMLVWQNDEIRVKKITLEQYKDKLLDQAKWLKKRSSLKHIPNVIAEETTEHYYYFDLEYREDYFPLFEYIHSHDVSESFKIIKRVLKFMSKNVYEYSTPTKHRKQVFKYIEQKVEGKINDTAQLNASISKLLTYKNIKVNGISYPNILETIEKIKNNSKKIAILEKYFETPIHGDLTVDNIISSETGDFLILDPNNENQVSTPAVDYGKIFQSLHSGYEFLIQLDTCDVRGNIISFEEIKSHKYEGIFSMLDKELKSTLSDAEYSSIFFHEAVHYCRMLTYRANINPETVPVFYATAVKLFNEFMDQKI